MNLARLPQCRGDSLGKRALQCIERISQIGLFERAQILVARREARNGGKPRLAFGD